MCDWIAVWCGDRLLFGCDGSLIGLLSAGMTACFGMMERLRHPGGGLSGMTGLVEI